MSHGRPEREREGGRDAGRREGREGDGEAGREGGREGDGEAGREGGRKFRYCGELLPRDASTLPLSGWPSP